MSETKSIDVTDLLANMDELPVTVASNDHGWDSNNATAAMRQLRAERGRELENAQHLGQQLAAERKRAERAEDWHSLVSQQKAELEATSAQLLARAEKAEAAVVAVADAAQHQRIRADKAEADVLRERQETYRVQQERDAAQRDANFFREQSKTISGELVRMRDVLEARVIDLERQLRTIECDRERLSWELAGCLTIAEAQKPSDYKRDVPTITLDAVNKLAAECDQWKQLGTEALDAVDRVFQVDSTKPPPLLPDFLLAGESKFGGVVKLAEAYLELRKAFDQRRADCDRLRSCTHCAVACDYNDACELLYGSGYGQLAVRVKELIAQRDRLRAERDDLERRLTESVQWNQTAAQYTAKIADLERQLAERPTMEQMLEATCNGIKECIGFDSRGPDTTSTLYQLVRWLDGQYPGECRAVMLRHFAPLAADGNSSTSSKSSEEPAAAWNPGEDLAKMVETESSPALVRVGPPKCERCGQPSMHGTKRDGCNWWFCDGCNWWFCDECRPPADTPAIPESSEGPPALPAAWVERCVEAMKDEIVQTDSALRIENETVYPSIWRAIRAALACIGPPTCERCGNRLARLCPQCDAAETFDGLLAKGPPTDLSAACVSDEDIRRGEEKP